MVRFLHIADTHIGCTTPSEFSNIREKDFLKSFEYCINIAIKEKVDFVIHSGDLFHSSNIPNSLLAEVVKILKELKDKNIPFYAIKGNHDLKGYTFPVFDILKYSGLIIEPESPGVYLNDKKVYILGISETRRYSNEKLREYYMNSFMYLKDFDPNQKFSDLELSILMSHTTLKEQGIPENDPRFFSKSVYPITFDYFALGHYHAPQVRVRKELSKYFVTPGSTERTEISRKEEKDIKKVILFDNGDITEIEIPVRDIEIIDIGTINDKDQLTNIFSVLYSKPKNRIIKLTGSITSETTWIDFISRISDLKDKLIIKDVKFKDLEVSKLIETKHEDEIISVDEFIAKYLEEASKKYSEQTIYFAKNLLYSDNPKEILDKEFSINIIDNDDKKTFRQTKLF